jgi:hypothetical protein
VKELHHRAVVFLHFVYLLLARHFLFTTTR